MSHCINCYMQADVPEEMLESADDDVTVKPKLYLMEVDSKRIHSSMQRDRFHVTTKYNTVQRTCLYYNAE